MDEMKCVDLFHVMKIAADLLGPAGDDLYVSDEYVRAIVEMTTMVLGLSTDDKDVVERVLWGMRRRQDA